MKKNNRKDVCSKLQRCEFQDFKVQTAHKTYAKNLETAERRSNEEAEYYRSMQ